MRILLVSSEVAPLAKTGGLADVAGSLPRALKQLGHDVRILMPGYRGIAARTEPRATGIDLEVPLGSRSIGGRLLETGLEGLPVYLLECPAFFDREQLYGTPDGDYPDNAERFGFFCRAALAALPHLDFRPDVLHLHDWQTALIPVLLRSELAGERFYAGIGSLLTIHNLGYQGIFPAETLSGLRLSAELFHPDALEYWGKISFLKGGVVFADRVNTVSPTYAAEICTPELGLGFDGILRSRGGDFSGILNGLDPAQWNPAEDPHLPAGYRPGDLRGKTRCKALLQKELGLQSDPSAPLVAMVTRLDVQKGLDLVEAGWSDLLQRPVQFALLGSGERGLMDRFGERGRQTPQRVAVRLDFDDGLARRIYGGSDLFLMPSRYEPCGLGQLIALRYGCVPLVRRTGGLADTIQDVSRAPRQGNGFSFDAYLGEALLASLDRALLEFRQRRSWLELVRRGMQEDFSWTRAADDYLKLYQDCQEDAHDRG